MAVLLSPIVVPLNQPNLFHERALVICWWIATNSYDISQIKNCNTEWLVFNYLDYSIDKNDDISVFPCQ